MNSQSLASDFYNLAGVESAINIDPGELNSFMFYNQMMNLNNNIDQTNSLGFTKDSVMLDYNNFQYSPPANPESNDLFRSDSLSSQLPSDQLQPNFGEPQYYPTMSYPYILPQNFTYPMVSNELGSFVPAVYWPNQMPSELPPKRIFSFVSMSQAKPKKRLRRKFDEIQRSFVCTHNNCRKAYGTLNNLNAHIIMQGHGPKRSASEFKPVAQQQPGLSNQDIKNTYLHI